MSVQHHVITSPDEFIDGYASAWTDPIVLRSGAIRAETARFAVDGTLLDVCDYDFPMVVRGETPSGHISAMLPLDRVAGRLNGTEFDFGTLCAGGGATELLAVTHGPARYAKFSAPIADLEATATALGADLELPGSAELRCVPVADGLRLREVCDEILREARSPGVAPPGPQWAASVGDVLKVALVRSFQDRPTKSALTVRRLNSVRIAQECEAYAESTHYHDVTSMALCAASGEKERRVRQAFYDCYDMSPTARLRITALHHVRRLLLDRPPQRDSVSRAAADFGFWHLGRFASQYRALFGESPSASVNRARLTREDHGDTAWEASA
jgi:AraC-like DNA-binding protein